ncbi:MAG TPA: hypothetical protein VMA31_12325 [Bryobacteraceae bacterium]|nr:hypothetical protein [Bryobacteraceae bacterium]
MSEALIGHARFLWAMEFTKAEDVTIALVVVLAVLVGIMAYRAWQSARIPPEERERQRREVLVSSGKMGDATLTEVQEGMLYYAYVVRGVEYTASQDVSLLKEQVPADLSALVAVSVRYDSRNPANSIVVAENWSGLRLGEQKKLG